MLKQGPRSAQHVLVLIPGTSAGAASFRLAAQAILKRSPGWQIWSIERRENLLEDNSRLRRYAAGRLGAQSLVDYYLSWLTDPAIAPHFEPKTSWSRRPSPASGA
ncbi:MAG: hypothetical protein U0R64_10460 [Candidatus Nanopelagicales bacterium]